MLRYKSIFTNRNEEKVFNRNSNPEKIKLFNIKTKEIKEIDLINYHKTIKSNKDLVAYNEKEHNIKEKVVKKTRKIKEEGK